MEKNTFFRNKGRIFLGTALLFFTVTMPCRIFFSISGMTEVRPAGAFPPVFGLLYGITGAAGCAVGNFLADILSGYPPGICIVGFFAQFFYGCLPYWLWHGFRNKRKEAVQLGNVHSVQRYIRIVLIDSIFMALCLGIILQGFGMGSFWSESTLLLFLNDLVFSLIIGIPMIIFITVKKKKGKLTLNVRFVLMFLLISVFSAVLVGIATCMNNAVVPEMSLLRWNRIYIRISVDFFAMYFISVVFLWYLEQNITKPMETLAGIARDYADQENVSKKDRHVLLKEEWVQQCERIGKKQGETGYLALAFKKMMLDVACYITDITEFTKEKERISTELGVASDIQSGMLPEPGAFQQANSEFLVSARMHPAKHVAGDFYDFFLEDRDHAVFLIADVSGKGIPASLFMMVAKTLIHSHTGDGKTAARVLDEVNRELCHSNPNNMFVTAWMGILTISDGTLSYVNAGHNAPLVRLGKNGFVYDEGQPDFVLAGLEQTVYTQREIVLQPGDMVFLYTDGVTEANNTREEMYGEDRLLSVLNENRDKAPEQLTNIVWDDVRTHQGDAKQFDDITMLAFCYRGTDMEVNNGPAEITRMEEVLQFVTSVLMKKQVPDEVMTSVEIAIDEMFSNICYYSGAAEISVSIRVTDEPEGYKNVLVCLEDDGAAYNPLDAQEPDIHMPAVQRKAGGLGIYMVKNMMDTVTYEYADGKNRLVLQKEGKCEAFLKMPSDACR